MNFFLCTNTDNTTQNIFTKLNFHTCVSPLIRKWKNIFIKLIFHTCVPPIDIVYILLTFNDEGGT